ncbi:MAG: YtxH domain-containing protein [Candidatus Kuenenia sp.]|nr:YtxH domain-containing protein [Candidatus Kuenenia sp.]
MENTSKIIIAALVGAAAGAIAGLLLAPKSGKETRQDITGGFSTLKDKLADLVSQGEEITSEKIEVLKEKIKMMEKEMKNHQKA